MFPGNVKLTKVFRKPCYSMQTFIMSRYFTCTWMLQWKTFFLTRSKELCLIQKGFKEFCLNKILFILLIKTNRNRNDNKIQIYQCCVKVENLSMLYFVFLINSVRTITKKIREHSRRLTTK